jgi:hypothetical protein
MNLEFLYDYHFARAYGQEFFIEWIPAKIVKGYSNPQEVRYLRKDRITEQFAKCYISCNYTCTTEDSEKKILWGKSKERTDELDSQVLSFMEQNGWKVEKGF